MTTPCLLAAQNDTRTEQAARYVRVLRLTEATKARGCRTIRIKVTDLAALIAIAAASDATVSP